MSRLIQVDARCLTAQPTTRWSGGFPQPKVEMTASQYDQRGRKIKWVQCGESEPAS
jgi:hypothetical protein